MATNNTKEYTSVSVDESDHGTNENKGKKFKKSNYWDIFKIPKKTKFDDREETLLYVLSVKIMKLLCYLVTFILVLGFSVLSKISLTLMSAQTVHKRTMDLCVEGTNKRYQIDSSPFERMGWNWALWFTIITPEVYSLLVSMWTLFFKQYKKPSRFTFMMILFSETCHIIGICLLLFVVFPTLDSLQAVMFMNSLCVLPALIILLSRYRSVEGLPIKLVIDICCLLALGGGLFLWAEASNSWLLPLAGVLVSIGWWENFTNPKSSNPIIKALGDIQEKLENENRRHFVYLIISSWKIVASFLFLLIHLSVTSEKLPTLWLIGNFTETFNSTPINLLQTWETTNDALKADKNFEITSNGMLPVYMLLIQIGASFFCFMSSVFACKARLQEFSFSFPLSVSIPVTVLILSSACSWRSEDQCLLTNIFPKYVFWSCPESEFVPSFLFTEHGWIWFLWFLSQAWVSKHIWPDDPKKLIARASTELLFINPSYNGAVIDQSLILNRRRYPKRKEKDPKKIDEEACTTNPVKPAFVDKIENNREHEEATRSERTVYACATMWHETPEEMIEMIKSIMRLEFDLYTKKNDSTNKEQNKNSVYNLEVHIFFDDAFTVEEVEKYDKTVNKDANKYKDVNKYVKYLVETMPKAARKIYPKEIRGISKNLEPQVYVTPYGGRLECKLPGETKFVVHLKDKTKIRAKKRWSQVMYMYYLLGFICLKQNENKQKWEDNTFILALDGDIDFKPGAVTRLLHLMTDDSLGAACGRIHPVGKGPIVWYQKFEYAIGHWLQKATEHVIGCVLCSPGCFSLFRAKALMEVMRKYSSEPKKAHHIIQYDQGEDRWLCTLLLKRGYRIEYSAASDAYTNAPNTFGGFYNQRRRWGPSTLANVVDLLLDYRETVSLNNSISTAYIMYQSMIMAGTILGPGTIFLMVVGAIVSAFAISNWIALVSNFVPVALFVLVCFFAKEKWQILFASWLSAAYALLMMAVLVGTLLQLQEDGVASPSGIFLIAITASFIIAAFIHPLEVSCLVHGFLYFLLVPSMYLLLTIYSFINLNNVSWGTREDPKKEDKDSSSAQKNEKSFLSKICQCFLRTDLNKSKKDKQAEQDKVKVNEEEPAWDPRNSWNFTRAYLSQEEETFWKEMIVKYLNVKSETEIKYEKKLDNENINEQDKAEFKKEQAKKEKEEVEAQLEELRNSVFFAFFMINSLFILIVFLLQMNKDKLFINWPINAKANVSYIPDGNRIRIDYEYLELEPIGLVFAIFFGIILIFQFVAMLIHRLTTFTHIMEDTDLSCKIQKTTEQEDEPCLSEDEEAGEATTSVEGKAISPSILRSSKKELPKNVKDRNVLQYLQDQEQEPKYQFNNLDEWRLHQENEKRKISLQRRRTTNGSFIQRTRSGNTAPKSLLDHPPPKGSVPDSQIKGHSNETFQED